MCDQHDFVFDVDRAYEDQLATVLSDSPEHPIRATEAPTNNGVYVIYRSGLPVYVGQARNLRNRLRDHLRKIENRIGIDPEEVSCRFLTIPRLWEIARERRKS